MKSFLMLFVLLLAMPGAVRAQAAAGPPAGAALMHRIDARSPQGLRDLFRHTDQPLPLVSAHRGGPQPGYPENCLATFENTLLHTFAIMEVDPRYTKDGQIVLHHDDTLGRTTTGRGKVSDFTLAELKALRLKDSAGNATEYQIPTLDEALEWARGKTVLVLDQKDVPAAERVKKVAQHKAESYTILIVYSFSDARGVYRLNPNVMMEVMVPSRAKAEEFDALGVPWANVVPFVGHTPPDDPALYEYIHCKGASCLIGTSRSLDRKVLTGQVADIGALEAGYRALLQRGADLIETDIPTLLGPLLYSKVTLPAAKAPYLHVPKPAPARRADL
ncbi:MAG: glycerophosphodiester phosphodiesterase family protein [Thermoguttaceae bacterium]|nr:glycerophosphodiester phosphodiesterase family protein [Thermoguttaceae bacterium]